MSWENTSSNRVVTLGNGPKHIAGVMGVYVGSRQGTYGLLHDLQVVVDPNVGPTGETVAVAGSKAIDDAIDPVQHVGKLMRLSFNGVKSLSNGKTLKQIGVDVWKDALPWTLTTGAAAEGSEDLPF